jgi:hypothetical protein
VGRIQQGGGHHGQRRQCALESHGSSPPSGWNRNRPAAPRTAHQQGLNAVARKCFARDAIIFHAASAEYRGSEIFSLAGIGRRSLPRFDALFSMTKRKIRATFTSRGEGCRNAAIEFCPELRDSQKTLHRNQQS